MFIHSDSTAVDVSASATAATNYIDMLHILVQFLTNQSVDTVAVNAGGTGYAVGDIVELDGGSHPSLIPNCRATFEVTAVSSGAVTAIRFRDSGSYTTPPGTTGISTTALSGSGNDDLTLDLTYASVGWTVDRQTQEAASATIGAGGSGYSAGDDVELNGGDTRVGYSDPRTDTPASFNVDSESSGVVTAVSVIDGGTYHNIPSNPAATTVLTGSGDNALTLNVTYSDVVDTTTDVEYWLTSSAGASIGLRSYTNGSTVFNWEIAAAPEFTSGNDWDAQVGISGGRYDLDTEGSYVILRDVSFNFYIRATDRYVVAVFNIDNGVYTNLFLGLHDPFATGTEYAYPGLVLGCTSDRDINNGTLGSIPTIAGGLNCAVANVLNADGPAQIYTPGGSWDAFYNGYRSSATILGDDDKYHIIPGGSFDPQDALIEEVDRIAHRQNSQGNDWGVFANVATATSAGGEDAPTDTFVPTPQSDASDDRILLTDCILVGIEPTNFIGGVIPGIKHLDRTLNTGTLNAEDTIADGDDFYVVFNNCALTARQHWFALKVTP